MAGSQRLALTLAGFLSILRGGTSTSEIPSIITCNGYLSQTSQSASLVCHYNKDLSDKGEDFMIRFCGQNPECVEAIACNWDNTSYGLLCVPDPTFEGMSCNVTSVQRGDLTCQLPNVRPHHSCCYTCHLVPSDERAQLPCAVSVPWEKEKDEEKSTSAHERLQTTLLIVLLAVVVVIIILFIGVKLKKRQRRESPEREPHNQDGSQSPNSTPASAGATGESQGQGPQHQARQNGPQDDTTPRRQSRGNGGRTENPVSSQNPQRTSVGTMTENTEGIPQAQGGQDVADHDETNDENAAGPTEPLLSGFGLNSTETTCEPPNMYTPPMVCSLSKTTYTAQVWVPDKNGERTLQSPQDSGISKVIDSSITRSETEASSSPTDPVTKETPEKIARSISVD